MTKIGARFASWFSMLALLLGGAKLADAQAPEPALHVDVPTDGIGQSLRMTMASGAPNQYFFRGLLQSDKGFIWQSHANLDVALYETESFRFIVPIGFWFSVQPGDKNSAGLGPAAWFESRLSGGFALEGPAYRGDLRLMVYSSPNGSFEDVYELNLRLELHDDVWWASGNSSALFRGFFPSVVVANELKGARDGRDPGLFFELGVAPRLRLFNSEAAVIDAALPLAMGLGHKYYQLVERDRMTPSDHLLGYVSAAVMFDILLKFLPERLGRSSTQPSVTLIVPTAAEGAQPRVSTTEFVAKIDGVLRF